MKVSINNSRKEEARKLKMKEEGKEISKGSGEKRQQREPT
jgi:hypothetical protein